MSWHWMAGASLLYLLILYLGVEMAWGGGNPSHKDHYRPPWNLG